MTETRQYVRVDTPIQNSQIYEIECPVGHTTQVILANAKYEVLFESGIDALRGGHLREAVSSFAVALERFYEYAIRFLLNPASTGPMLAPDPNQVNFDKTWKAISKMSERQIGAFYVLYFNVMNESPTLFDGAFLKSLKINLNIEGNDPVKFRNKVIHEGFIPDSNQALLYGEAVNMYIQFNMAKFTNVYGLNVQRPRLQDIYNSTNGNMIMNSNVGTFLNMIYNDSTNQSPSLISYMKGNVI